IVTRRDADEFQPVEAQQQVPEYFIAFAGASPLPLAHHGSIFLDECNEILKDHERTIQELIEGKAYQAAALEWCEAQLAGRRESLASLQEAFAWHKSQIESLTKTRDFLDTEIEHYKTVLTSRDEGLAWRASQVTELEASIEEFKKGVAWQEHRYEDLQRAM